MRFKQWDGHDIDDDTTYETPYVFEQAPSGSYATDPIEADGPEVFPTAISVQPQGRDFSLNIYIKGTITRASFATLDQWFDPSPHLGERYLTAEDENLVGRRLLCRPLQVTHVGNNQVQVAMRAASGIWEAEIETYSSTAVTATNQAIAIANAGNTRAPLRLAITPTASKAATDGPQWMRRMGLANRNPDKDLDDPIGDGYPLDLGQALLDTAALTTAKMLASGDDLLVWDSGQFVPRWLTNMDSTATSVWRNRREPRGVSITLAAAMASSSVPAAGTLFALSNAALTDELGLDEFVVIDTEIIHVQKASRSELRVLQRGALGSTAAAHSAGATGWRMANPYERIAYSWSAAPVYDDYGISDLKPLINLALSSNTKHVWDSSFYVPTGTRRSGGWLPEKSDDGPTSDYIRTYERKTAAQFTRANSEYLSIADNADLSVSGNQDFGYGAWFYFDSLPAAVMSLMGKQAAAAPNFEYNLYWNNSTGFISFNLSSDGTAITTVTDTNTIQTGRWYFVYVWHDSVLDTINIQVNGGTPVSAAHSTGAHDDANAFQIGASASANFFDGRAQMAIFHKRVLGAAERAWLYNNGIGRRFEEVFWMSSSGFRLNLIDIWQLNELSGSRAGIAGNNLTDNNTVTTAEGIVPGDALVFEDALAAAGKPSFNNAVRDFPVPYDASPAAIEVDETVDYNALLHGYMTDVGGFESRLIKQNYTAALTNQQFTPSALGQRLRLNGRIGNLVGSLPATMITGTLTQAANTTRYWVFTIAEDSWISGLVVYMVKTGSPTTPVTVGIYPGIPDGSILGFTIASIAVANIPTTLGAVYVSLTSGAAFLTAGTYFLSFYRGDATGTISTAQNSSTAPTFVSGFQQYTGTTASQAVPAGMILTDRSDVEARALTSTSHKALIDNFEVTLVSAQAPLIVMGAEEACYAHDSRWRLVRNLVTNSSFESNTTGHAANATSTIARSTEQAHYDPVRGFFGKASLKCTYGNNLILDEYAITLPVASQSYTATCWVYIPAAWNTGADIALDFVNFGSSTPGTQVNADLTKRDQWQQIRLTELMSADVAGLLRIVSSGTAPTATEFIYIDDLQIEPGVEPYADGYFATDGEEGGDYFDLSFIQALNQRLEIDTGRRLVIDRELNLPAPFALTPSKADGWPVLAPGFNVLKPTEAAASAIALTVEASHRAAYLT